MKRFLSCLLLGLTLFGHSAMAVEEPTHTVVLHDGSFELRDYPARVVAEAVVTGDQLAAGSSGFRLLAGYIFGGNAERQHIEMTAPVAQFPMPADGSAPAAAQNWTVWFFMPNGAARATLPSPDNARVRLVTLPAQRLAVLRYSGWSTAAGFVRRSADLLATCASRHLQPVGPVMLAQYNPPWTLWFLRRNEVMVPVQP